MHSFDAARKDFSPYGLTCVEWTPTPMPKPDRHNEIELNYLPAGSLTYLLGGERVTVPAGRLALFWAAIPHQIVAWEGSQPYHVATLPLAWFLQCALPESLAHPVLQGKIVSDTQAHDDEIRFQRWTADMQSKDERRTEAALLEIQARLLRFALALDQSKSSATKKASDRSTVGELSRADQLACHIAQHFAEPLTADQIARAVGLHPNYAMNVFRKAFGITMTQFVVQHRLYNAQRLLVTTEDPILDLALESGFQSVSRFNEVFKQAFHCTPRDYRKAHR